MKSIFVVGLLHSKELDMNDDLNKSLNEESELISREKHDQSQGEY